ncbi:putative Hybrid PKS-NRPS biosynthetic cluster [Taiwanofungus camphoratus]|nr:putative Hybrid PKS-NRPS biosynthetic cluster [Antrodia cinnamomea]
MMKHKDVDRNTTESTTIRKAGLLERYYVTRHYLGMDSCIVVSASYASIDSTTAILDRSALYAALGKVVHRHAALGMRLSGESTSCPTFARLDKIDLSKVVEFTDHSDLAAAMEAHFLRRFDTDAALPLWRLQVLKDNTLIFAYHHGIGDGQSGLAFHRALLSALNENETEASASGGTEVVAVPKSSTLVPPVEKLTSLSVSFRKLCSEMSGLFAPSWWSARSSTWTGHSIVTVPTLVTRVRLVQYTPEETARMLGLCRSHKSTVTSFIHTLAVLILSRLIPRETSPRQKYRTLCTTIPVSLRRYTNTSEDEMCIHVAVYASYPALHIYTPETSLAEDFPWNIAAKLTSTLRKDSELRRTREGIGMLRFLFGNYEGYFKGMLGKERTCSFEVSNIGRFPSTTKAIDSPPNERGSRGWSITTMQFAQSSPVFGAAIKLNVVGTPAGGLGISITWGEGSLDDAFAELFTAKFKEGMTEIISSITGVSNAHT